MISPDLASMALTGIAWLCAFFMGFTVNRGGACAVMAMHDWVERRSADRLLGLAIASGAAGLVFLPLGNALGPHAHLAAFGSIAATVVIGGVLMGAGAMLNRACLLGSLGRLGNGELRLLALPIGLGLGYALITRFGTSFLPAPMPGGLKPGWPTAAVILAALTLLIASWQALRAREGQYEQPTPRLSTAMLMLGIVGATLYLLQPGWSYADAVRRGVAPAMVMMLSGTGGLVAALLTVAGAVVSAGLAGVFTPRRPAPGELMRTIGGGALMAVGARLIPGGNDALLLATIPAGSLSGLIGFATMSATIFALTWGSGGRRRAALRS